ncbi:MAG: GTP-binding protein [Oscillospiraceae bacterium]|nr:GTP-binding protein [Oscillospiraceae bacterium]
MSDLNSTPRGERLHIGIFGKRNRGKSTLMNAITGQSAAVVSPTAGTTTDPVYKAMELLPVGPVVLIDTAGIDDTGDLGELRTSKSREILRKCDIALLVVDSRGCTAFDVHEQALIDTFDELSVRYMVVYNDFSDNFAETLPALKSKLTEIAADNAPKQHLIADLLKAGDVIVLVTPIDESAPKGRLILPQQQVIRDALEAGAFPLLTQTAGLSQALAALKSAPRLVVTDSQAFGQVAKAVGENQPLTSFSILFARYKGVLKESVRGAKAIDTMKHGDKVMISEGCTHHKQCDDIGTVKLPRMLERHTGVALDYTFTSGGEFPDSADLAAYKLIIHCGGCVLNGREMRHRQSAAVNAHTPMTNYGVAISHMQGILERCVCEFKNIF